MHTNNCNLSLLIAHEHLHCLQFLSRSSNNNGKELDKNSTNGTQGLSQNPRSGVADHDPLLTIT